MIGAELFEGKTMTVRKWITFAGLAAFAAWSPALAQTSGSSGEKTGKQSTGSSASGAQTGGAAAAGEAGGAQANADHARGSKQGLKSVVGTVESLKGDTLTLRNKLNETHEFTLDDQTKFMRGGQKISRDDIKSGETVRAAFRTEGKKLHATEVKLEGGQGGSHASKSGSSSQGSSQESGSSQSSGSTSQEKGSQSGTGSTGSSGSSGSNGTGSTGSTGSSSQRSGSAQSK